MGPMTKSCILSSGPSSYGVATKKAFVAAVLTSAQTQYTFSQNISPVLKKLLLNTFVNFVLFQICTLIRAGIDVQEPSCLIIYFMHFHPSIYILLKGFEIY